MTAAAFVVDPSTGHVDELERASGGLAIEWVADRKLAVAGDTAWSSSSSAASRSRSTHEGLLSPRRRPRCAAEETPEEPTDDDVGDEGSDAPASL